MLSLKFSWQWRPWGTKHLSTKQNHCTKYIITGYSKSTLHWTRLWRYQRNRIGQAIDCPCDSLVVQLGFSWMGKTMVMFSTMDPVRMVIYTYSYLFIYIYIFNIYIYIQFYLELHLRIVLCCSEIWKTQQV